MEKIKPQNPDTSSSKAELDKEPPFSRGYIEDALIAAAVKDAEKGGEQTRKLEKALEGVDEETARRMGIADKERFLSKQRAIIEAVQHKKEYEEEKSKLLKVEKDLEKLDGEIWRTEQTLGVGQGSSTLDYLTSYLLVRNRKKMVSDLKEKRDARKKLTADKTTLEEKLRQLRPGRS